MTVTKPWIFATKPVAECDPCSTEIFSVCHPHITNLCRLQGDSPANILLGSSTLHNVPPAADDLMTVLLSRCDGCCLAPAARRRASRVSLRLWAFVPQLAVSAAGARAGGGAESGATTGRSRLASQISSADERAWV